MKKTKATLKKLLSALLVAVMLLGVAPVSGIADFDWGSLFATKAAAATEGYYTYSVSDGKAEITDVDASISGDIEIPSTLGGYPVTSIGDWAFYYCTSLTSITIPDSVTSIDDYAFYYCTGLTNIKVDADNTVYDSRNNCNAIIETETNTLIQGCKNTVIPNSVTSIGDNTFSGCSGLTNITIPNSVTSIGYNAFEYCTGLTSIVITDSVTSIGGCAFYYTGYYNDESNWENDVLYIGNHLIEANDIISGAYEIKDGTKTIADSAFSYRIGLTSITIPDSVTSIGTYAFSGCSGLTSLTIPDSVTSIGEYAFDGCSGLTSITIPDSVTSICDFAFLGCTGLIDVYYMSSEEDWNKINIDNLYGGNNALLNATIHFNYVPDIPNDFVLTDENTGIKIEYSTELDNDTEILVDEIFDGESLQLISAAYGDVKTKLFNISLQKDGDKVQPSGEVTVKIPLPADFNPNKVFVTYVDSNNGKVTKIDCEVKDGYVVFKTNHFSEYAIVEQLGGVESVSLGNVTMDYKSSRTLTPEIIAAESTDYTVTYSSDSKNVTVDENGKLYAAKRGSANITVTVTDSNGNTFTDTCKVTVEYAWWQWLIKIVLFGWIWY